MLLQRTFLWMQYDAISSFFLLDSEHVGRAIHCLGRPIRFEKTMHMVKDLKSLHVHIKKELEFHTVSMDFACKMS